MSQAMIIKIIMILQDMMDNAEQDVVDKYQEEYKFAWYDMEVILHFPYSFKRLFMLLNNFAQAYHKCI